MSQVEPGEIWPINNIAIFLGYIAIHNTYIDISKMSSLWRFTKTRLQLAIAHLSGKTAKMYLLIYMARFYTPMIHNFSVGVTISV